MKHLPLLILLLASPTLAWETHVLGLFPNGKPNNAGCVTIAQASKQIDDSKKHCGKTDALSMVWFKICRGEVVNAHPVLDDSTVYPDFVCSKDVKP